jgi:hypothetical protein
MTTPRAQPPYLPGPSPSRGHPRAPFASIIGASRLVNGGPLRMLCYSVRQQLSGYTF